MGTEGLTLSRGPKCHVLTDGSQNRQICTFAPKEPYHTGVAKTDPSEVKGFRVYWGYIGIMEKKMEATILGCRVYSRGLGFRVYGSGLVLWGLGFLSDFCLE